MSDQGTQCLLCYDTSSDAIILPCGNVACVKCLQEDFDDNTLFCQLCLKNHKGEDLYHLESDDKDCLSTTETGSNMNTNSNADTLSNESNAENSSNGGVAADSWVKRGHSSVTSPFIPCAEKGCEYRAVCGDWCYTHIPPEKRRGSLSLILTDESARSLASTSLAMVASELTPSPSHSRHNTGSGSGALAIVGSETGTDYGDVRPRTNRFSRRISLTAPVTTTAAAEDTVGLNVLTNDSSNAAATDILVDASAAVPDTSIPPPAAISLEESCTPLSVFSRFHRQERLSMTEVVHVIETCRDLIATEPNVLNLQAPLIAVGDLHGQFYDLCHILQQFESSPVAASSSSASANTAATSLTTTMPPSSVVSAMETAAVDGSHSNSMSPDEETASTTATSLTKEFTLTFDFLENHATKAEQTQGQVRQQQFLFLGDYVDRGSFSCEVLLGLLVLKIAYPKQVHLIRGNHECSSLTHHFGFREECKVKYGVMIYHLFCSLFRALPLAATIQTDFGTLFACHGGLSPSFRTLAEIQNINRFVEPEQDNSVLDILWADPLTDDDLISMTDAECGVFLETEWKPNPHRGCSYMFGYKVVRRFLDENGLVCMVRAHEVQNEGYRRHFEPALMAQRSQQLIRQQMERQKKDGSNSINSACLSSGENVANAASKAVEISSTNANLDNAIGIGDVNFIVAAPDSEHCRVESFPPVITVFSAPNYCDRYANKGAVLRIDTSLQGFEFIQYQCVEHPVPLVLAQSEAEVHLQAVIAQCPYIPTSFDKFVSHALALGPAQIDLDTIIDAADADTDADISIDMSHLSTTPLPSPVHSLSIPPPPPPPLPADSDSSGSGSGSGFDSEFTLSPPPAAVSASSLSIQVESAATSVTSSIENTPSKNTATHRNHRGVVNGSDNGDAGLDGNDSDNAADAVRNPDPNRSKFRLSPRVSSPWHSPGATAASARGHSESNGADSPLSASAFLARASGHGFHSPVAAAAAVSVVNGLDGGVRARVRENSINNDNNSSSSGSSSNNNSSNTGNKSNVGSRGGEGGIFRGVVPTTPIRGSQQMGLLQLAPDEVAMIDPLNIFSPTLERPLQAHVFQRYVSPTKPLNPNDTTETQVNPLMRLSADGSLSLNYGNDSPTFKPGSFSSFVKSGYAIFKRTVSITRPPLSVFQITSPRPVRYQHQQQRQPDQSGNVAGRLFQSPRAKQRQCVTSSLFVERDCDCDESRSESSSIATSACVSTSLSGSRSELIGPCNGNSDTAILAASVTAESAVVPLSVSVPDVGDVAGTPVRNPLYPVMLTPVVVAPTKTHTAASISVKGNETPNTSSDTSLRTDINTSTSMNSSTSASINTSINTAVNSTTTTTSNMSVIVPVTPPPPSVGSSGVVSYVAIPSPVPMESAAYVQAAASDAINEIHPRSLEKVFKGNHWLQKSRTVREAETGTYAASVNKMFELDVNPPEKGFSVRSLMQRYERNCGNSNSDGGMNSRMSGELTMNTPTKGARARRLADVRACVDTAGVSVSSLKAQYANKVAAAGIPMTSSNPVVFAGAGVGGRGRGPVGESCSTRAGISANNSVDGSASATTASPELQQQLKPELSPIMAGTTVPLSDVARVGAGSDMETVSEMVVYVETSGGIDDADADVDADVDADADVEPKLEYESDPEPEGAVLFSQSELVALRLMFSLFDRSNTGFISYDDFIAYAEDCSETDMVRHIWACIEIIDIDNDGAIGFLDFVHFAERLKARYREAETEAAMKIEMESAQDKNEQMQPQPQPQRQ